MLQCASFGQQAVLFLLFYLLSFCDSLRKPHQIQQCLDIKHHRTRTTLEECHLVPDYCEHYYYNSLREKFDEIMSVNNCTTSGEPTGFGTVGKADLHVQVIPPQEAVLRRWGTFRHEKFHVSNLTYRTNEKLCLSKDFKDFKYGGYKDAKGCGKMTYYDRMGRLIKGIKRRGATLHPEHIRCESKRASDTCMEASKRSMPLDNDLRQFHHYPFLITAKQAIVSRGGQLSLPCGYVGLFASCEAWGWGLMNVTATIPKHAPQLCRDVDNGKSNGENNCPFPMYDRVFIVTSYDDTQIGQFIQEALPKLVYHLDFILANKDIKLHYGFTKQLAQLPKFVLPHMIFQWLGLSDRLVNGTVYAKTVYMPREGGCQDVGYNAWELLTTRELFLSKAGVDQDNLHSQRSVVIIRRSSSPYTKNQGDHLQRRWPKKELQILIDQFKVLFPQHRVDVYSDLDKDLMRCRACQIKMFADADVVLAAHGAGLTNTMFMRPGGLVVEVVPVFDSRHAPVIGIFPRLSGIIGLHHHTYYIGDMRKFTAAPLLRVVESYAREIGVPGVTSPS